MPSATSWAVRAIVGRRPWIVGLMVLLIGHVGLVLSRTYGTGGDWAFIELRTSDVFSTHSPLTGAWSRYGWNHPGPILYDVLSVPYLLAGSSWRGLWLGALTLNAIALAVAVRLLEPVADARTFTVAALDRVGSDHVGSDHVGSDGPGGTTPAGGGAAWLPAWAIAVAGLWTLAAGTPHLLTDPWNASVVVVPVLTMVAATTAVLSGDRRGVAVSAVVFVAAAQTHAAYGVLLLPLVLVAVGSGFVRWRRFTLICVGGSSVLMIPALIDTVVNWPGNFMRSLRFTLTADEPAVGFAQALRVIGRATSLSFFTDPRLPSFVAIVRDPPWGVVPFAGVLALVAAHRFTARQGWTMHRRTIEATALTWFGGVLMVSRTRGPLLIWLTTWMVAAAATTWCLVVAVMVRWALGRRTRSSDGRAVGDLVVRLAAGRLDNASPATSASDPERHAGRPGRSGAVGTAIGVGVITLGFAAVNVAGSVGEGYPFEEYTPVVEQFADDSEALAGSPIAIDLAGDEYVAGAVQSGLIVELEDRGFAPRTRPDQRLQMGDHRAPASLAPPSLLVRVESQSGAPAGATAVSVWDPLTEAERAEADALTTELGALLDEAGVGDRRVLLENDLAPLATIDAAPEVTAELASFERLGDLRARGQRIVLYLLEP